MRKQTLQRFHLFSAKRFKSTIWGAELRTAEGLAGWSGKNFLGKIEKPVDLTK
jgi:hypothetical protein